MLDHNGFKEEGFLFPASSAQIDLYSKFYKDINFDPSLVNYVEAHATGTLVGDPEESKALDAVFCRNRTEALPVGSVKSNMGHGEATSALCSISKIILSFESGFIPPNINYVSPKHIPAILEGRLRVVTETEKLKGRYVAMDSLGAGGSKAHILLEGNDREKVNFGIPSDDLPRLLTWSGRTEEAVQIIFDDVIKRPLDVEFLTLLQSTQLNTNYDNIYRGYGIFKHDEETNKAICLKKEVQHFDGDKRPVVWVYSGMGSQWNKMGVDLLKFPIFAAAIEKCHNALLPKGLDLKRILTTTQENLFDDILNSFVGITAVQIGLTDVLAAMGLKPDYIVGHSMGELGCAYGDGCLTAEEAILSSWSRGVVSNSTKLIVGAMAAVGIGYQQIKDIVPDDIIVACHNGEDSCTISGPAARIREFVAELKSKSIFAKEVAVSNIAYHSKYIADMGPNLMKQLSEIITEPKKRSSKWLSSSVPYERWDTIETQYCSAHYQTNNLLSPVLFEETCKHLPRNALTVEIAPHGLLRSILKTAFPNGVQISLTKKASDGTLFLVDSLGQ